MSPVPEVMLAVLALLIVLGFLAGPRTKTGAHSNKNVGAVLGANANVADQKGFQAAAGNTSAQVMSTPEVFKEDQLKQSKQGLGRN